MSEAITDISLNGLNAIRAYEGRALRAYQDVVGVWTIGYGITAMDKGIGFKVGPGVTITADQAEELLYSSIRRNYMPKVEQVLNFDRCPNPQGAMDGGLSFHFNTGGIGRASWPAQLMAGNMSSARTAFESWNKAGGKVVGGLVRRRASEWNIISKGDYGKLSGPEEEGTRGQRIGTGNLLMALPGQVAPAPGTQLTALPLAQATDMSVGSVKENGIPVHDTPAPGTLKAGATGPAVVEIQKALTASGHPTPVTGTFDETTEANVADFQQTHPQLSTDGTVGPATASALVRAQDMRNKTATIAKLAPVVPAVSIGLWQFVSEHAANIVMYGGVTLVVVALLYIGWQHQNEIRGSINRLLGCKVP